MVCNWMGKVLETVECFFTSLLLYHEAKQSKHKNLVKTDFKLLFKSYLKGLIFANQILTQLFHVLYVRPKVPNSDHQIY